MKYPGIADLFAAQPSPESIQQLGSGAALLPGFVQRRESELLNEIEQIAARSPFRHMITPGGYRMSVAMTNCGALGWVTDLHGYRYDPMDPIAKRTWPEMPSVFLELAVSAAARAGYESFQPDACLINRYQPRSHLSLHQDKDEHDNAAPIVSVSLGVPATFLWGGLKRTDRTRRIPLQSGDVVVWGGASRFVYHGIAALAHHAHPLTGAHRFNLTFRRAGG